MPVMDLFESLGFVIHVTRHFNSLLHWVPGGAMLWG